MKVILTGATGFIGSSILSALLLHPSVTSVVVLSRRALTAHKNSSKLVVLIIDDFLKYDAATIQHLQGAEACIWCLGTPTGGKVVHMDYTMAGVKAVQESLPKEGGKMTFVYVSGGLVEPDQEKTLLFLGKERKMRGQVEHLITDLEKQSSAGQWRSIIARPGLVSNGESLMRFVTSFYIPVEVLGHALADIAVKGSEKQRMENTDLKERGKAVIAAAKANPTPPAKEAYLPA